MGDDAVARALARDPGAAEVSPGDRAMLDYALELTRDPASVAPGDVDRLREHRFSDRAILDICQVTAYYAYVNRLADGLGVELEESWTEEELVLSREEFEARRTVREKKGS